MKKVLSVILAIILICSIIPFGVFRVAASSVTTGTTGDCTWTLDGTVLTISGEGAMSNYNNTSNQVPWGRNLTEVIIENGVTSIGNFAFYFCTALKSISIPSSVKSIGNSAFYYCNSLSGIVIPDNVTSIGSEAFSDCWKISEVKLPDSLISIGKEAFLLCNITSITIPKNVSIIGASAFGYCTLLTSIEVDENNATYYSANNCIIQKSTNALVAGCKSSVIPDGVTSIQDHAFTGCSAQGNITIPNSVTRIGGWAFAGSDYTSITLPKSVTYITYGAFYLCDNLADVYYAGNRINKNGITVGTDNDPLKNATWHYAPCENDAHVYDNACTTTCKNCDYERTTTTAHTFDNDCDEVCNVCGAHRKGKHVFERVGENVATCKNCNISKSFDFIITTDETITLSYNATQLFDFVIEDTSVAKIGNVSSSVISMGSYYRQSSSAKISSVFPGETTVKFVASNGTVITSSSLFVIEGSHQMVLMETLNTKTCENDGLDLYECKFCGYEEERINKKTGHNWEDETCTSPKTCTTCGTTEGTAKGHSWKAATCTTPKTCSTCGTTSGSANGHTWRKATCTNPKTCTVCKTTEGKSLGHTWKDATCDKPKICTRCKASSGSPVGHIYDDGVDGTCNVCSIHRETTEKRTVMHMFRMYDPNSGEHFYTGSVEERDFLVSVGWNYEGVGFTFSRTTGMPVYRLYDPVYGEHLYTMDVAERDVLVAQGWNLEGIAFNSAYDTEVPQYRLHNPNAKRGAYHFTASIAERDMLIALGWEYQGIGFYSSWK